MIYPKTNSLWKREEIKEGKTRKLMPGHYARTEFGALKLWHVQEKIDGMNIRIIIKNGTVSFLGRSDEASIPPKLLSFLQEHFNAPRIQRLLEYLGEKHEKITLFGEGYGASIQNGGNYIDGQKFILFDVYTNRWSSLAEIYAVAHCLDLSTPHDYGFMTLDEIQMLVESKPQSKTAIREKQIEGVICRSFPLMINAETGERVMFKLKCKDV